MTKLKSEDVARVLNASTKIKSYEKIAEESHVSSSTVFNIMKDFPLWDFVRSNNKDGRNK